jgi:hypothetical protein
MQRCRCFDAANSLGDDGSLALAHFLVCSCSTEPEWPQSAPVRKPKDSARAGPIGCPKRRNSAQGRGVTASGKPAVILFDPTAHTLGTRFLWARSHEADRLLNSGDWPAYGGPMLCQSRRRQIRVASGHLRLKAPARSCTCAGVASTAPRSETALLRLPFAERVKAEGSRVQALKIASLSAPFSLRYA